MKQILGLAAMLAVGSVAFAKSGADKAAWNTCKTQVTQADATLKGKALKAAISKCVADTKTAASAAKSETPAVTTEKTTTTEAPAAPAKQ